VSAFYCLNRKNAEKSKDSQEITPVVKNYRWNKIFYISLNKYNQKERIMTHADVWHAIERFANAHGMSCSGLAKRSGLDPTTFNRSKRWSREGQPRWPSTNSISKILASTGASIQDFAKYIDVPSPENERR